MLRIGLRGALRIHVPSLQMKASAWAASIWNG